MFNNLYVERYRPRKLEDIVLTAEERAYFESLKSKEEIPNLLFAGNPGTGKTTLSKIIATDILDCQYLYINASDENGIDTIRSKVIGFASTKSLDGKLKIVLFDECLEENTLVTVLRNGKDIQIPIKDVDECEDLVKTFNFKKDRIEWRPFYKIDRGKQDVYEVQLENGESIICTASHKWYVEENGAVVRKTLKEILELNITQIVSLNN